MVEDEVVRYDPSVVTPVSRWPMRDEACAIVQLFLIDRGYRVAQRDCDELVDRVLELARRDFEPVVLAVAEAFRLVQENEPADGTEDE